MLEKGRSQSYDQDESGPRQVTSSKYGPKQKQACGVQADK